MVHVEPALGGEGFAKVCDGNVWKKLEGLVSVEEIDDTTCEVSIELSGKTKTLVPEFTIKGPMEDQIREMTLALEAKLAR